MSRAIRTLGALGLSLAIAACAGDGSGSRPADDSAAPPAASAGPAEAAGGGMPATRGTGGIVGSVRYSGPVPEPRTVPVEGDAAACGDSRRIDALTLGPDGGLRDAVVALAVGGIPPTAASATSAGPLLDQVGCEFVPHIVLARVGDTVRVRNSDPLTHNVHTAAFDNRTVNRMQPGGAPELELTFTAPERVKVQCDIHPWMSAWIIVTDHPWAAVTDEDGGFALDGVPAGPRNVEVWHEALGEEVRPVTVEEGRAAELAIELSGRDQDSR